MSDIALNVQRREPGRKTAKKLRREGLVPGIYYVNGSDPIPFAVHPLQLRSIVYTRDAKMVKLNVEGESGEHPCVLKDISFDPITDKIVHIDFHGVIFGKPMHFEVPVTLVGNSIGVREGGLMDHILHKVQIECLPKNMPEHLEVDVTDLKMGASIHVRDLNFENITILTSGDATVAVVAAPRGASTGDDQANVPAGAEPALVDQKGKQDDEA